jgi:hypothetical protein
MGRRFLRTVICLAWLAGTASAAIAADTVAIQAAPVALHPNELERNTLGRLLYRGGLSLSAPDSRFGGLSDLSVTPDGKRFLAVSDRGHWVEGDILYDAAGRLVGMANGRLGPLNDLRGRRLMGLAGDAEGLAVYPDGSLLVAFERRHRLWLYPPSDPPFQRAPRVVPLPRGASAMPENGGMEALLRLSGGRLIALSEELVDGRNHVGWIGDGIVWEELRYRAAVDFKPTAMTQIPSDTAQAGDVLVLERRFTLLDGPGARITRHRRNALRPGATLDGEELGILRQPLTVDNFEGIAAARGARGETLIYLLSDDNFSFWQRTLLLMFELPK